MSCNAYVNRKQDFCGRSPVLGKSKCAQHGGLSTGPKTPEGRARCAAAKTVHGRETRAIRRERQVAAARLRFLEDLMVRLRMMCGSRTRGRRPALDGTPDGFPRGLLVYL